MIPSKIILDWSVPCSMGIKIQYNKLKTMLNEDGDDVLLTTITPYLGLIIVMTPQSMDAHTSGN